MKSLNIFITDLQGEKQEVTDIDEAIKQAECFMSNDLNFPENPFVKKRNEYWADIHRKLKISKELKEYYFNDDQSIIVFGEVNHNDLCKVSRRVINEMIGWRSYSPSEPNGLYIVEWCFC